MSRILVADDDPDIRQLVAAALIEQGHDVTAVEDGTAVLEHIGREAPELLVLDLLMPGCSGFEVLDALRGTRAFPVLAISAISGLKDPRYAKQIGADTFLAKPFSLEELERMVAELLGKTVPS